MQDHRSRLFNNRRAHSDIQNNAMGIMPPISRTLLSIGHWRVSILWNQTVMNSEINYK